MIDMSPKACGRNPITIPDCDEDSCEALVSEAKAELREELRDSQAAQNQVYDGKLANIEYPTLKEKPSINGVPLVGNKTTEDLGITVITPEQADMIPMLEDEVSDARVGEDGTTYQSLGAAIRGQVGNLKEDISDALIGVVRVDADGMFYVTMED